METSLTSKWILLFWIIPVMFLVDDILGFNGYQFTIHGIGIRILLFCLTVASLGILCLIVFISKRMTLFKKVEERPFFWSYWKPIDAFVLGFLVLNLLWATVIPMVVRHQMQYGLKDCSTILVFVLYFPCVFLIRNDMFPRKAFMRWAYPLLILLALWHTVMYIGETVSPGFYAGYYDFIDVISLGSAVRTDVVFGFGITRIIQTTSMLLIPALFLAWDKFLERKWLGTACGVLVIFAILITYTKSIWFGCLGAVLVVMAGLLMFEKDRTAKRRGLVGGALMLAMIVVFNCVCLNNTIFTRAMNGIFPSQSGQTNDLDVKYEQLKAQIAELEAKGESADALREELAYLERLMQDSTGSKIANGIRAQQKEALLKKWSSSKLLGYGYGAYAEDMIRNDTYPFMYEYTLPALLMKIGIVGLAGWLIFIAALVIYAWRSMWKPLRSHFLLWLACAMAFGLAVQTNPFLFTFAGFSVLLYLCLEIEWESARSLQK